MEICLHPIKPNIPGLPEPEYSSVPSRALHRVISNNKYPEEGQSPALLQFQFSWGSGHSSTTMKCIIYHIQKRRADDNIGGKKDANDQAELQAERVISKPGADQ